MTRAKALKILSFGGPATYRVVIQGEVSQSWVRRLAGMEVTTTSRESDAARTILEGRIPDQSALRGLLETLHALHLPILEVTKLASEDDDEPAANMGSSAAAPERDPPATTTR